MDYRYLVPMIAIILNFSCKKRDNSTESNAMNEYGETCPVFISDFKDQTDEVPYVKKSIYGLNLKSSKKLGLQDADSAAKEDAQLAAKLQEITELELKARLGQEKEHWQAAMAALKIAAGEITVSKENLQSIEKKLAENKDPKKAPELMKDREAAYLKWMKTEEKFDAITVESKRKMYRMQLCMQKAENNEIEIGRNFYVYDMNIWKIAEGAKLLNPDKPEQKENYAAAIERIRYLANRYKKLKDREKETVERDLSNEHMTLYRVRDNQKDGTGFDLKVPSKQPGFLILVYLE